MKKCYLDKIDSDSAKDLLQHTIAIIITFVIITIAIVVTTIVVIITTAIIINNNLRNSLNS